MINELKSELTKLGSALLSALRKVTNKSKSLKNTLKTMVGGKKNDK